jgi:hypothetical protein
MNINQKIVSLGTAALIVLMTLYPPLINNLPNGYNKGAGYEWIFTSTAATVNIEVLLIQIFVALFVGGVLYLVLDKRNNK